MIKLWGRGITADDNRSLEGTGRCDVPSGGENRTVTDRLVGLVTQTIPRTDERIAGISESDAALLLI
jgi:hypothetical protein